MPAQTGADAPDLHALLVDLIHQIDISEFKDELGHRLKMNVAYHNAKDALARIAETAPERARPADIPPEYRTWRTGP